MVCNKKHPMPPAPFSDRVWHVTGPRRSQESTAPPISVPRSLQAKAMAHNVRDDMLARGWTKETWLASQHTIDPYVDAAAGGLWLVNPYRSTTPPAVVIASAPPPPTFRESAYPPGSLSAGAFASAVLTSWLAPLVANKAPAATPLLVVGQSCWDAVAKAVADSGQSAYPRSSPRMPASELPADDTRAMVLRSNAHDARVLNVALPSLASAAALAPGWLRAALPQHSIIFYAPAPADVYPHVPGIIRQNFTIITWPMMHPELAAGARPDAPASDPLQTIESSFLRVGGTPQLGLTPGQRMGLEPTSHRDMAFAVMQQHAADAKQEEYDFVVNLLRGANVFGHFCESRTCGGAGSCHADDSGAFNGYLSAMQAAREDPALLDALSKHAERKKYEVASYIACWDPNSQYGQVMDVAGEYVLSSATGCRIPSRRGRRARRAGDDGCVPELHYAARRTASTSLLAPFRLVPMIIQVNEVFRALADELGARGNHSLLAVRSRLKQVALRLAKYLLTSPVCASVTGWLNACKLPYDRTRQV